MRVKRTVAVLLGLTLVVGSLSATATMEEPTTDVMRVMTLASTAPDWSKGMELWTIQQTAAVADITIKVETFPRDVYQDKLIALLASDDLPDAIDMWHEDQTALINGNGMRGRFLAIDTHLDQMPNVKAALEPYRDQWPLIQADDGHIYTLPTVQEVRTHETWYALLARVDILAEGDPNYLEPRSIDEFFEGLQYLQQRNDGRPILGAEYGALNIFPLSLIFGFEWWADPEVYWDPDAMRYSHATKQPDRVKDFVRLVERMVDAGMVHPDFLTMDGRTYGAHLIDGDFPLHLAASGHIAWLNGEYTERVEATEPQHPWGFILPPPYRGKVQTWHYEPARHLFWGWALNANPGLPLEKLLATWDWTFSPEGRIAWYYGQEGVTFRREPDGQIRLLAWPMDRETGGFDLFYNQIGISNDWQYPKNALTLNLRRAHPDGFDDYQLREAQRFVNFMPHVVPPLTSLTGAERDEASQIAGRVRTAMDEYMAKVLLGRESAEGFDTVVTFAERAGVDRLIQIYDDAHDRFYGTTARRSSFGKGALEN